ncbi:hypothetical protein E0L93_09590 [Rubrobacter taiwanensis]|jgi:hypothetical protein|uniref:Uncharacterized protein n=1 Tax=Rubrobacter taiwanensis TaxID=185139 RepID=A0A4R1BI30_9ACTN|nr:hypothetical protein [Rubrobacter taiwanensis]TCJ16936.1 hypothetical protein E0L93_09590 [Rubrobacter taiwanensis]
MSLLRGILALVILIILTHVVLVYLGYGADTHEVISVIYALGDLLQTPVQMFLAAGFYTTSLVAAAAYFLLYLLLGAARR